MDKNNVGYNFDDSMAMFEDFGGRIVMLVTGYLQLGSNRYWRRMLETKYVGDK